VSAPRFTPGPWQVNHSDPLQVCDTDGDVRGCSPIATTHGPRVEAKANARLIAAAPELLEAVTLAYAFLAGGSCYETERWRAAFDAARAAIAKATQP